MAIITNAGGPGIVACDMSVTAGLTLAKFSEETIETLSSHLPNTANVMVRILLVFLLFLQKHVIYLHLTHIIL
jgi:acyl-CoA synthetase (NDP forming)